MFCVPDIALIYLFDPFLYSVSVYTAPHSTVSHFIVISRRSYVLSSWCEAALRPGGILKAAHAKTVSVTKLHNHNRTNCNRASMCD
jgi:hypothetical protein